MPGQLLEGIQIAETPNAEQPIARTRAQLTAFVGRTLRGPVDSPVIIRSFADFQQTFGGLWQPSPLSYAVEHFFEQGGRHAVIVRVVNSAAPATLSLRCGREALVLEALAPGTREFLRASVDYDHVDSHDQQRFNLVVQRVRAPGSERIEEQEIFRGLSVDPDADRFVTAALLESKMVRVRRPVPATRPNPTLMPGTNLPVGYVSSNPDGHDGRPLSDYDIIGSATRRTGLHALAGIENLAFVYIPPLSRTAEIGISTIMIATKFCRDHHALLIVDPPVNWDAPAAAIQGLKSLNFHSDNALMFYPRILCTDRLRGRGEVFGNGGAVAGLLSRLDDSVAIVATPGPEPLLRAGTRLARDINTADRSRLATAGINVLQTVRSVERDRPALRTLACGASASADWAYLTPRRFVLYVISTIERGTRWAVTMPNDHSMQQRLDRQIREFLEELRAAGAFASVPAREAYAVICDERINDAEERGTVNILIQLAANHAGEYHSFMITHTLRDSLVRPVVINRLESSFLAYNALEREITIKLQVEEQLARVFAN
ncbi:MAG TPA: phage tail sheath C-terminal domain-containing protein [Povalibacter sp.]|nr:phage tail sheath C-terminal domain-containing protein [Povalibacter sp.]